MKHVLFALLLCPTLTACLQPAEPVDAPSTARDDARQSQAPQPITGHELDRVAPKICSAFIDLCPAEETNVCSFICCDGFSDTVRSSCGDCVDYATDVCETPEHANGIRFVFFSDLP